MPGPLIILFVTMYTSALASPKPHGNKTTCQEYTQGLTFEDSQAIGTWHLLQYSNEKANGTGEVPCVEFTLVDDQERKQLSERIGKYVENMKWDSLTLKMQTPCAGTGNNRTREYYLERLESDGSYRTLQMPPPTAKLDLADFHRYPMRLKIVESQYLGMMDCHEKFVFLLGKQPPNGSELDDQLKKMIDIYWPEEQHGTQYSQI